MSYAESRLGMELARARASSRHGLRRETEQFDNGFQPWGFYNGDYRDYDFRFKGLLSPGGFLELVRAMPQGIAIIDAFAPSSFIRSLARDSGSVAAGVALALGDLRSQKEKNDDAARGILQIENGDIYSSGLWMDQARAHLGKYGKEKADLIVCLPMGGWDMVTEEGHFEPVSVEMMWLATNRLWGLLNTEGSLFIHYKSIDFSALKSWQRTLTDKHIEVANNGKGSLLLKKNPESPKTLPFIKA